MKITESVLRKIIAEEIAVAYEEGRLDEGFLDDLKSKFSGMAGKLFGKKEQPASDTPAAKSSSKMKSSDPYAGELMVAQKKAAKTFESTKNTIASVFDTVGVINNAASANKPPALANIKLLKDQLQPLQKIVFFGKQTISGFPEEKKNELFQDLNVLASSKNPAEIVGLSKKVLFSLDLLKKTVEKNEKSLQTNPDKFAEDFYTTRLSGEPFKFEGKIKRKTIKESPEAPQGSGEIKDTAVVSLMGKLKQLGLQADVPTQYLSSAMMDIKQEKFEGLDVKELAALGKVFLNLIKSPNDQAVTAIANVLKGTDEQPK
jgi:hypothetical protein